MRFISIVLVGLLGSAGWAQPPIKQTAATGSIATGAVATGAIKDLPVRKVVLYKNGVGYFEHAGSVSGTQKVGVDFTSAQLNDVLQSLTVLDEGGGRIGGVNYNSTTPIDVQLKSIGLGLKDYPATVAVYQAFRGQRVEVTGAGAAFSGRLVNIEFHKLTDKNGASTEDRYFLIVATDGGALRTAELTDSVSVRMLDAAMQKQLGDYLRVIGSAAEQQARHLTFTDAGQGQRELRVSYISEVPVWKSTYRMVFPREANGKATLQGWAVVDNTVGSDWDNVQLALVAGAPQSFIQPLSQPLYVQRPEIAIAVEDQFKPETHEAAEHVANVQSEMLTAPTRVPHNIQMVTSKEAKSQSFGVAGMEGVGGGIGSGSGNGYGAGMGGNVAGGVYRASDAMQEGDVATKAFDDYFEYALSQPVTIHKNESAMVPILQQDLPAEHVTLWNEHSSAPLRAVWLTNASQLTLDRGSFSIYEGGEFAGEGLLDPIHPGERRLLSYAADQAVAVRVLDRQKARKLHHVSLQKGVLTETQMDESAVTYSVTNSADVAREVLVESPRQSGWTLEDGVQADETAADVFRFKLTVKAHENTRLEVRQHGPSKTWVQLDPHQNQSEFLLKLSSDAPETLAALQPVINAQVDVAKLDGKIQESKAAEDAASKDEGRMRDNLTALKTSDAASRRFVDELNKAEDTLQAAQKQTHEFEQRKQEALEKLQAQIGGLSYEWDVR
jgi:hypothetical protein